MKQQWRNSRETTTPEVLNLLRNYTKNPFPWGKLSRLEHLCLGGLSLAVAFVFSGRYAISGDVGSRGRQRGHDLTQLQLFELSLDASSALACSLAPAKKEDVLPSPHI